MSKSMPLVGDESILGFRVQTEWRWLIATAFFLGKIGGGLFMVSVFLNFSVGALVGIVIAGAGKGAAHLLYLGRPERFWRIIANPMTSWISRGLLAMVVFIVFGLLYLAPGYGLLPLATDSGLFMLIKVIAIIGALVVMVYDGFVMNASPAIPMWNTALLPVLCFFYSILGGTTLTVFLHSLGYGVIMNLELLEFVEISLFIINLVVVLMYVITMFNTTAAAREAVNMLVKGKYSAMFFGLVIIVGLVLSLILAFYYMATGNHTMVYLITAADLIGHFFIFFSLLAAGVYSPVMGKISL